MLKILNNASAKNKLNELEIFLISPVSEAWMVTKQNVASREQCLCTRTSIHAHAFGPAKTSLFSKHFALGYMTSSPCTLSKLISRANALQITTDEFINTTTALRTEELETMQ